MCLPMTPTPTHATRIDIVAPTSAVLAIFDGVWRFTLGELVDTTEQGLSHSARLALCWLTLTAARGAEVTQRRRHAGLSSA